MANPIIVATLNVSFDDDSEGSDGLLKLEIDDREDGRNGGDTSFNPGDDVYYFLFKDRDVTVLEHEVTAGGKTFIENATRILDENITFANSDSASLNYPPDTTVTMEWLGRCFTIDGSDVSVNTQLPEVNGSQLKMAGGMPVAGILHVEYESTGELYKLSGVPLDFNEVLIFAIGQQQ